MMKNPNSLKCSCGLEVDWVATDSIHIVDLLKFLVDGHGHHWYNGASLAIYVPTNYVSQP